MRKLLLAGMSLIPLSASVAAAWAASIVRCDAGGINLNAVSSLQTCMMPQGDVGAYDMAAIGAQRSLPQCWEEGSHHHRRVWVVERQISLPKAGTERAVIDDVADLNQQISACQDQCI